MARWQYLGGSGREIPLYNLDVVPGDVVDCSVRPDTVLFRQIDGNTPVTASLTFPSSVATVDGVTLTVRGARLPSTAYAVNDAVCHDGQAWRCVVAYTSSSGDYFNPAQAVHWTRATITNTPPGGGTSAPTLGSSISGNRPLVATRTANTSNSAIGNVQGTARVRHVATKSCSDIRLVFGMPLYAEAGGVNQVQVKAGLEVLTPASGLSSALSTSGAITSLPVYALGSAIPSGTAVTITSGGNSQTFTTSATATIGAASLTVTSQTPNFAYPAGSPVALPMVLPVTFAGKATGSFDPNGYIISDAIGVELTAGQVFWTRNFVNTPMFNAGSNTSYVATNASSTIGATSLTSAALIPNPVPGQVVTIDQGGNAETAILANPAISGAGPYTYNFTTALTKAHASGAVFGQQTLANAVLYSDLGEGWVNGQDQSWTSTAIAGVSGAISTTLNAAANGGDTVVKCAAGIVCASLTIDTAGAQETVAVRNVQGTASPYTYYLSAPLAQSHSSGVAAVSNLTNQLGMAPLAIVADKLATGTSPSSVVAMASDSIAAGTGHPRASTSFLSLALDGLVAYVNTAKAGEAAYQYVQVPTSQLRRKLITLGTWSFVEDSTNDLYGGQTLAQVQANIQAACLLAKQRGLKVAITTCLPRTTSTDLWTTASGQTVAASSTNTTRIAYNTWLRAWQSNGLKSTYVDALFDLANVVEVNSAGTLTQNGGLWLADASGPYTADGIHPTTAGHVLLATGVPVATFA